jgi:hypothetical protein
MMVWKTSEIVGALLGAAAALPVAVWGFVVGGTFIGAATGGWLAIPGALFGAGLVIFAGVRVGWNVSSAAVALARNLRPRRKP